MLGPNYFIISNNNKKLYLHNFLLKFLHFFFLQFKKWNLSKILKALNSHIYTHEIWQESIQKQQQQKQSYFLIIIIILVVKQNKKKFSNKKKNFSSSLIHETRLDFFWVERFLGFFSVFCSF